MLSSAVVGVWEAKIRLRRNFVNPMIIVPVRSCCRDEILPQQRREIDAACRSLSDVVMACSENIFPKRMSWPMPLMPHAAVPADQPRIFRARSDACLEKRMA